MFEILKGGKKEELKYCIVWPDPTGRLISVCGDMDKIREAERLIEGSKSACLIEVGPDGRPRSVCDSSEMIRAILIRLK